jgi:hypothetical protein
MAHLNPPGLRLFKPIDLLETNFLANFMFRLLRHKKEVASYSNQATLSQINAVIHEMPIFSFTVTTN